MTLLNSGFVTVSIRDSGTGLSSENISRLFQEGVQFNANELQVRKAVPISVILSHNQSITLSSKSLLLTILSQVLKID